MRHRYDVTVATLIQALLVTAPGRAQESSGAEPTKEVEVTVQGERRAPAATGLSAAETRQMPGAFGDPFRAIESLPGVTPIATGSPFFFVRGSPPGNIGYFLDGIRVPYLYHLGLGPSVIHPRLVKNVELHPGGYPARYGRFTGGVVAADTTSPRYELRGEASLRLVDAGALIEAPFADNRGTVSASGRYGYPGLLLPLFAPDVVLEYWDYQARASYDLTPEDRVSVFSFGAHDLLAERKSNGEQEVQFSTEFHRVDLRYDKQLSNDSSLRIAVLTGFDASQATEGLLIRDRIVGLRSEILTRLSSKTAIRFGTDATMDSFSRTVTNRLDFDDNNIHLGQAEYRLDQLFKPRTDLALGAYVEAVHQTAPGLTLSPGIRADYYASDGASAVGVDPRVAARFEVTPKLRLIHTLGLVHQPPSFVGPIPGLTIAGLPGGLQRSIQASSGIEIELPADITATATVFDHIFLGMTDVVGASRWRGSPNAGRATTVYDERSQGSTVGLELYVRRPFTRRLTGFATYTLSRSTRSMGREHFPARFDRTHVLNLAAAYDLGRRWRAGCRFVAYSGNPADVANEAGTRDAHPRRLPTFHRFDVRVEKRWPIGRRGYWSLVFEVLNATLRKETISSDCHILTGECEQEQIGPVTIPSIGVEAAL